MAFVTGDTSSVSKPDMRESIIEGVRTPAEEHKKEMSGYVGSSPILDKGRRTRAKSPQSGPAKRTAHTQLSHMFARRPYENIT